MRKLFFSLPFIFGVILSGCGDGNGNHQVISQRYIHKYGYAVSQSEWEANRYPGQVITTYRNGVTMTATYENGVLHGPCTYTHPHSQTVQYFKLYNLGDLKKEIVYDVNAMPIKEKVQLSPHRYCITKWFGDGTPMSIEDFADEELIDGQYFSLNNELESRVERGNGLRLRKDKQGALLSKDHFDSGYMKLRESFYPNGNLKSTTPYVFNKINGERRTFASNGNLLGMEEWVNDQLHGKAIYFANGKKQKEIFFVNGIRHGIETHFLDGERIEQEIYWNRNRRHGPTKFYVGDAIAKTEWYYAGQLVSKKKFDELDQLDQMITRQSLELNHPTVR